MLALQSVLGMFSYMSIKYLKNNRQLNIGGMKK
jgi:hypothetical protein